jgi:UDP-N-acetylmuramyl pentapeptide phosphotransferase/UDP-N-acetylglucosamine-1-phosphate transferase
MSTTVSYALVPVAAALACSAVIFALLRRSGGIPLDRPNERSLHTAPVPRIGGLGIMGGTLIAFALLRIVPTMAALACALVIVSYLDDRTHLPIALRFSAHIAAAVAFIVVFIADLPLAWQAIAVAAIVWMTNLYNFMDGSDGLAGGMAVFGFTAYALAFWLANELPLAALAVSVAAAAAAFLMFNFHPARVFLGDAGSIPVGFLAAAIGILGWHGGSWPIWFPILVFSPFIVDATVTLCRRVLRGERFWRAHRIHYYQRLVQLGWGHRNTALAEYALMAACGTVALWVLDKSPTVQAIVLAATALSYVALAAAVDAAWRRHARTLDARPS